MQFPQMFNPHREALLYVFEDNEAVIKMIIEGRSPTTVIKMIIEGRSPTMRQSFQNPQSCSDSKIQIKHIDTKNQFADILTKGEFHT